MVQTKWTLQFYKLISMKKNTFYVILMSLPHQKRQEQLISCSIVEDDASQGTMSGVLWLSKPRCLQYISVLDCVLSN